MITFSLHPEREKSLLRHHPWIFSKAVAQVCDGTGHELSKKEVASGTLCQVVAADGRFLCYAHYSAHSQILLRVISFQQEDVPDGANSTLRANLVKERLSAAKQRRAALLARGEQGIRLVAAEGDYLPGLIVDKFNDVIVLAVNSWGMEALYEQLVQGLHELFPECTLYERSDAKARLTEQLPLRVGYIDPNDISTGYNLVKKDGSPQPGSKRIAPNGTSVKTIPDTLYVRENNLVEMPIDVLKGHKTGGYLDQRASRYHCYELCAELKALSDQGKTGPSVLNCFCYTGGFCLSALKGGARAVINVDVSQPALNAAKAGVVHNRLDPGRCKFINRDVFEFLRQEVKLGHKYDVVILDHDERIADVAQNRAQAADIARLVLALGDELGAVGERDILIRDRAEIRGRVDRRLSGLPLLVDAAQRVQHALPDEQQAEAARVHHARLFQHGVLVHGLIQRRAAALERRLEHRLRGQRRVGLTRLDRVLRRYARHGQDGALSGLHDRFIGGFRCLDEGLGQNGGIDGLLLHDHPAEAPEKLGQNHAGIAPGPPQGAAGNGLADACHIRFLNRRHGLGRRLNRHGHVRSRISVRYRKYVQFIDPFLFAFKSLGSCQKHLRQAASVNCLQIHNYCPP